MQIVFTDAAKEQLETKAAGSGRLKLVYDTEGCGCAVNGVPDLWIEPAQPEHSGELAVESNYVPVACDRKSEVFLKTG
ncbi:hypothetical protein N6H14_29880 [Paenibacillus sp. CC-CFT747]|nr:hypothetical protein N6H14_29880 [Paenibacillus sp. CC-CFT747]